MLLLSLTGPRFQKEVLGFVERQKKEKIVHLRDLYGLKGIITNIDII